MFTQTKFTTGFFGKMDDILVNGSEWTYIGKGRMDVILSKLCNIEAASLVPHPKSH